MFDVCCGTGTIGLCLANRCQKVIGVDCIPEAVENARNNAIHNGITNAEFYAGKSALINILNVAWFWEFLGGIAQLNR